MSFRGTILLVSHDREFLNNIVTAVFGFEENGKITEIVGGYDEWKKHLQNSAAQTAPKPQVQTQAKPAPKRAKLSNKEREELAQIPLKIAEHEAEQKDIAEKLQDADFIIKNPHLIAGLQERSREIESEDEILFERWSELDARNSK